VNSQRHLLIKQETSQRSRRSDSEELSIIKIPPQTELDKAVKMKHRVSLGRYDFPDQPQGETVTYLPGRSQTKSVDRQEFCSLDKNIDSKELQIRLQKRMRNLHNEEIRSVFENPVTRKYIRLPDLSFGEDTLNNILGFETETYTLTNSKSE